MWIFNLCSLYLWDRLRQSIIYMYCYFEHYPWEWSLILILNSGVGCYTCLQLPPAFVLSQTLRICMSYDLVTVWISSYQYATELFLDAQNNNYFTNTNPKAPEEITPGTYLALQYQAVSDRKKQIKIMSQFPSDMFWRHPTRILCRTYSVMW